MIGSWQGRIICTVYSNLACECKYLSRPILCAINRSINISTFRVSTKRFQVWSTNRGDSKMDYLVTWQIVTKHYVTFGLRPRKNTGFYTKYGTATRPAISLTPFKSYPGLELTGGLNPPSSRSQPPLARLKKNTPGGSGFFSLEPLPDLTHPRK